METTNTAAHDSGKGDWAPLPVIPAGTEPKPDRVYSVRERALLAVAVAVAFLFDRLILRSFADDFLDLPFFSGVFWLLFLAGFYAFYWKRLRGNRILWLVSGLTAALCVWNFLFDYRSAYGALTTLVVPCVLMAWCQYFAGDYSLKQAGETAFAWLSGWLVKPFVSIPHFFGAAGSATGPNKRNLKRVLSAVIIVVPVLTVILPLLCSADMVFGYYADRVLSVLNVQSFFVHAMLVILFSMLFYSFLWQAGFAEKRKYTAFASGATIDVVVSCAVLGCVIAIYFLFCGVQFTYLFAGAGLPDGITYSEYAREGFAQIIMICAINLALFGVFLRFGKRCRVMTLLLALLLGATAVMLVSGFLRLRLYIGAYGMTWLRLLSAWFLLYLAVVMVLCAVRMAKEKLPLIAVSALALLVWYATLGYVNPDALILRYNLRASEDPAAWLLENRYFVEQLSNDAMIELLESGADPWAVRAGIHPDSGYGLSSLRLRLAAEKYGYEMFE